MLGDAAQADAAAEAALGGGSPMMSFIRPESAPKRPGPHDLWIARCLYMPAEREAGSEREGALRGAARLWRVVGLIGV